MAAIPKKFAGTALPSASTTHYTVPASKKAIVKNIVVCNITAADKVLSLTMGGVSVIGNMTITANDTVVLDTSIVLNVGETIATAASATGIECIISGVEVDA